tara:strand:+ start:1511 stop:1948 length:438 start_codon:yes stop_codon:yes gene_type:complete
MFSNLILFLFLGFLHGFEALSKKKILNNKNIYQILLIDSFIYFILVSILYFSTNDTKNITNVFSNLSANNIFYLVLGLVSFLCYTILRFKLINDNTLSNLITLEESSIILAGLIIGILFFNEKISVNKVIGTILLIMGIYFINKI